MLRWVGGIVVLLAGLFEVQIAFAQEAPPAAVASVRPSQPVIAYNGSFVTSVPIEVPAFRGIEPRLAVSYDSGTSINGVPDFGGFV